MQWKIVAENPDGTVTLRETTSGAGFRAALAEVPTVTAGQVQEYVCQLEEAISRAGRALVLPQVARRVRATGQDEDEVWQALSVQLWAMQRSPRSCWDPARGLAATTYVRRFGVGRAHSVLRDLALHDMRTGRDAVSLSDAPDGGLPEPVQEATSGEVSEAEAWRRIEALLDTDEERQVAALLAAGYGRREIADRMGWTVGTTATMITRVRALLLPLRED